MTIRRAIDFTAGAVGLIVFGIPIVTMIAAARYASGKSGIFHQTRYGLNGRPFEILKIRTLDDKLKPLPLTGKLRRMGLDEPPQVINLIKGDISLVGPRADSRMFPGANGQRMLLVPPGLVGLNAVLEKRAGVENSPEVRSAIEASYVERRLSGNAQSLFTDAKILIQAIAIAATGRADAGKFTQRHFPTKGLG